MRRATQREAGRPDAASGAPPPPEAASAAVPQAAVFLGLGSNVGDRLGALQTALDALAGAGVAVEAVSAVYETEAHVLPGAAPQTDHLNAAARVRTALAPEALLGVLRRAERAAGRDHAAPPWSPRPLDVDVLLWGTREIRTPRLTVPHPRLPARRFALRPLADLAPEAPVPGTGRTAGDLLAATADRARVRPYAGALRLPGACQPTDAPPPTAPPEAAGGS